MAAVTATVQVFDAHQGEKMDTALTLVEVGLSAGLTYIGILLAKDTSAHEQWKQEVEALKDKIGLIRLKRALNGMIRTRFFPGGSGCSCGSVRFLRHQPAHTCWPFGGPQLPFWRGPHENGVF